jgi:hypothetical protein
MSEDQGPSPSVIHAAHDVRTVISRLRRRIRAAGEIGDLSFTQVSVLTRLVDGEGLTTSDLAKSEGMRPQSMATTVSCLAAL